MNCVSHQRGWFVVLANVLLWGFQAPCPAQEPATAEKQSPSIRARAILDFGFEEPKGHPQSGGVTAILKNNPRRVDSPFWGQAGRRAIVLNASQKQLVQIPDGPPVDRPQAVSLSLFFLNLHPLNEGGFHGLVAKRAESNAKSITNYGINYRPNNDALQLYLNDGGGFQSVVYSVKQILNTRRLLHLTATWEVGDAPAPDADSDKDDVRVRLFLNGKPLAPKSAAKGQVSAADGWLLNINVPKLLNDVPVTIGSSTPTREFTSGVVDEFLLFDTALNDEQAAKLFHEVAGTNADELVKKESQPVAAVVPRPKINTTSLHGLQAGHTTQLTITGTNLGPHPHVVLPGLFLEQEILKGSNAGRLNVKLTLPENSPLGWFPLFVETERGISQPVPMAVDVLPQRTVNTASPEQPAKLPAAFSGQIAGENIIKIPFRGQAGDRIAAEVEAKRLGANFDPVVEIKTERGTPLKIGWSETTLRGDARAEVRLPKDGMYFAELHDLAYKARGQNRFRLKLGDFRSIDQWFPAKIAPGRRVSVKAVGTGLPDDPSLEIVSGAKLSPNEALHPNFFAGWTVLGPAPALEVSQAQEVLESSSQTGQQTIDATFRKQAHLPVAINGLIAKPDEIDRYLLNVKPGQKLRFTVKARTLPSPLDALLTVRNPPDGRVLVYKEDSGTARDPQTDFTVPGGVKQIQVGVQDLHNRGGERFVYRLTIAPANAPDFSLKLKSPALTLPAEGTGVVEMQLTRRGYNGPIQLRVESSDSITAVPDQIPAGKGNRDLFVLLDRKAKEDSRGFRPLSIMAQSAGLKPELTRYVEVGAVSLPGQETLLPVFVGPPAPLNIAVLKVPPVLFKGVPVEIPLTLKPRGETKLPPVVRLDLLTTEPERLNDPKDPKKGNKPKIRAPKYQALQSDAKRGTLKITVPVDVAVQEIDAVVKAELVRHAYSGEVAGTAYSDPFKLSIQTAATVTLDKKTFNLKAGQAAKIQGTIQRAKGFEEEVVVSLDIDFKDFQTSDVIVPPGQTAFEIPVTYVKIMRRNPLTLGPGKTTKALVTLKKTKGGQILNVPRNQPLELKIQPAK